MDNQWELLEETFGMPQAELLGSYLEAQGIPVLLSQEGAGHALGLTVGTLGRVEILVPSQMLETARRAMETLNPHPVSAEEPVDVPQEEQPLQAPDTAPPDIAPIDQSPTDTGEPLS